MIADGYELICVDESCFTFRGYQKKEWANAGENLELYKFAGGPKLNYISCCGSISNNGKEIFVYQPAAFNGETFLDFA